jgi:Lrp/AsnC family transcriptional regulator, regulator for asnA, asnC and gidA
MKDIDLKDRRILFELDRNCRQSLSQIGKEVGLAKSIVAYRIKRLTSMGIIKNYYTVVDLYKLGFIAPRFHFVYQYVTPEIQKEIVDYFVKNKYTFIVVSTYGPFDLSVLLGIRDIRKMYQIWQDIQNKFGYYLESQSLAFYINEIHLSPEYLLGEQKRKAQERHIKKISGNQEIVELDEMELKILNEISGNAQVPLTSLAQQLNLSSRQIGYRIKKMIESGVIESFRTEIDISKLGYQSYKVYIYLREFRQRHQIVNYLITHPNLICIDTTTGESHLEMEFHLKNVDSLHSLLQDVSEKFPNAIRNYQYCSVKEVHKWVYLPQVLQTI